METKRIRFYPGIVQLPVGTFGMIIGGKGLVYYRVNETKVLESKRNFMTAGEATRWVEHQKNFDNFSEPEEIKV